MNRSCIEDFNLTAKIVSLAIRFFFFPSSVDVTFHSAATIVAVAVVTLAAVVAVTDSNSSV